MNTITLRLVVLAACLVFLSCALPPAVKSPDTPYLPTPHGTVLEMLRLAAVTGRDRLYDLGCGDGRVVVAAALNYGAHATGVELDAGLMAEATAAAEAAGVSERTSFVNGDFFTVNLRDASVVTLYLLPGVNVMLRPKLLSELTPGSRVVSHMHDMAEWRPDRTIRTGNSTVYLWVIPADVDGTWDMTVDSGPSPVRATLFLRQSFQDLSGTLASSRKKVRIANAGLDGTAIRFTTTGIPGGRRQESRFTGQVHGNYIEGTAAGENAGSSYRWTAQRRK